MFQTREGRSGIFENEGMMSKPIECLGIDVQRTWAARVLTITHKERFASVREVRVELLPILAPDKSL